MTAPSIEVSIVVPTFNERGNVEELCRRLSQVLQGIAWEVVFVDDDSPDGTAARVRELARADGRIRCLQRIGRRGLSRAVIEGLLSTSAPIVCVMDADLQHDEAILPAMLARLMAADSAADVVVASRYVPGAGIADDWAPARARMSRLAIAACERLLPTGLSDPMSGFFAMRREVFESAVHQLSGEGYKVLLDLLMSAPGRVRVVEVPYRFRARVSGESKLDSAVLWEFVMLLLDKRFGKVVAARFVMFSLVGASGVLVHFAVLSLAFRVLGLAFPAAQAAATFTAMTSNYGLNNSLTYRDQRHRGKAWWKGLLSFYAVCGLGVLANVGVASALFARQGWVWAAVAGTLVGTLWNYLASKVLTWKAK